MLANRSQQARDGLVILFASFIARLLLVPLSYFYITPYSEADVVGFVKFAREISSGVIPLTEVLTHLGDIYYLWGGLLAPFWVSPGPSKLYAHIFIAAIGSISVYNIYLIASHLHSRRAGWFAALPLAFYPSFVIIHSTLHREALVLFGLTTAARLVFAPSPNLSKGQKIVLAGSALGIASLGRLDNLPIYALSVGAGVVVYAAREFDAARETAVGSSVLGVASLPILWSYASRAVDLLAQVRSNRAYGRTAYLTDVIPSTLPEVVAFSWVGAAYFFYTPFPWMVHQISDAIIAFEAVGNLAMTLFAVGGVRYTAHRRLAATVALLVGLVLFALLYGVGSANVGTAVRHRQMFVWVIFVFGGIGLAQRVEIKW